MQDDRVKVYSYNRRRIKYIFVMVCIAATVIIGRLAYIMVLKAKYYSERADNLHERERSIKAPRGRIYDRNGNILADNRAVCSVSVIHSQIEDEELLISLEDQIFTYQQGAREPLSCPESMQIRSVAHFRSLIDQVLEDDRNGKMLDADEVFAELEKEWGIEEEARNR